MSEATITIPAEHVPTIRLHLFIGLSQFGSVLEGEAWKERPGTTIDAVDKIRGLADAMEQIEWWEGDGGRTLSADRELLAEPFGDALEYAKDDVSRVERGDLDALMARIKWLSETLDSFEPEKVGAV